MSTIWILLAVVNANAWLFPIPTDKFGWGLRVRTLDFNQPYLAHENIEHHEVEIALINRSKEIREYLLPGMSGKIRDLEVSIMRPNGQPLPSYHASYVIKFSKAHPQLLAGQLQAFKFAFVRSGYAHLSEPGDYELHATLKTDEGLAVAPAFKLKVIEPTADAILFSQPIPLEGQFAKWSKERQDLAVIQQIKVGNRTWLFYRKFYSPENGGKVSATFRIAELPGKVVDFKVEGAFGDGNPLTITYREHTYTKWTTTHVINSVDGRPWTAAEEKHRQEKLKLEAKLPAEKK